MKKLPLALGTQTVYGTIEAVGSLQGERYYWMTDKYRCVSMIPAFVLEQEELGGEFQKVLDDNRWDLYET